MSKASDFIKEHTKNCNNVVPDYYGVTSLSFYAWLTPDDVLKAVEIAREEVIEEIENILLSEVLPCFMHGGDAGDLVAMLDEKLNKKQ